MQHLENSTGFFKIKIIPFKWCSGAVIDRTMKWLLFVRELPQFVVFYEKKKNPVSSIAYFLYAGSRTFY